VFEKSKAETFQGVHPVFANLPSRASERFFLITAIAHRLTGQLLATVPTTEVPMPSNESAIAFFHIVVTFQIIPHHITTTHQ
jgi:hypothetical protein